MQSNFPKVPLLLSAILLVLSCLGVLFLYRAIKDNDARTQLREIEWQKEAQRRDEIKALDRSVKMVEEDKIKLETHFARSFDAVPFLNTIEELASRAGTKGEVTSVAVAKDNTGLFVGMKASGTFAGIYKFLTLLENSPYELEFMAMSMNQEAAGKWGVAFKIKLLSFVE